MNSCPCGSGLTYDACCGPFLSGEKQPQTALELMRSRYTAYSKGDIAYIEKTMQGKASVGFDPKTAQKWADSVTFNKLDIISTSQGTKEDSIGYVEFIAHFIDHGTQKQTREHSVFHKTDGKWYYTGRVNP